MGRHSFGFEAALCAVMLAAASAFGEVLVYEGFSTSDYTVGNLNTQKGVGKSVGFSAANGWSTGTGVFTVQDGGLPLPGAWTESGSNVHTTENGRAVLLNSQGFTTSRAHRGQQRLLSCTWPDSGSVYFRFLMRIPQDCLQGTYLGNWNFVMGGLGFDGLPNPTVNSCTVTNGLYMGVRNRNGTLEAFAYVQPKGGTLTSYPLFNVATDKQFNCVFVAKIDIGENGHDTLSLFACPVESWSNEFEWKEVISDVSLVSGQDKFKYLQMIGQYPTANKWLTLDEFIVTTDEDEAYTHRSPDAPTLGDVALTRTGSTYSLSAAESVNAASLSWIADDGATITTNGTTDVAQGGSANWTLSGLTADKTYNITVLAENAAGVQAKPVGSIYTGDLTIGATTDASEATLSAGTVVVSRASADPVPLTVRYTITGTGTEGVTWEAPVEVMIPANETSVTVSVVPLVDLSVAEDITVTVAFEAGGSTTLKIFNSDLPDGWDLQTITNAFDNPAGGYLRSSTGLVLTNTANRIISFAALGSGAEGLREFITQPSGNIETSYVNRDWLLYSAAQTKPSASSTQPAVIASMETLTSGITAKRTSYTYAGSWYIPAAGTYSFRMNMLGVGVFSLDGRLVLKQNAGGTAVTTNGVALAAGWHNFCVSFVAHASNAKLGPATGETLGFSFSDSNAALTKSAPGSAFNSENCQFNTAFNAVLLPYLCANGANLTIDCSNVAGDLRIAGVLVSRNNGTFTVVNLPAGRTLEIGRPLRTFVHGYYEFQNINEFGFVDWSKTTIPSGVNVRFEGALAINDTWKTHGPGATSVTNYTIGNHALLVTEVAGFFGELGAEFPYPAGLAYLHIVNPQVLGQTAKIIVPANGGLGIGGKAITQSTTSVSPNLSNAEGYVFQNDIELGADAAVNGTATWNGSHVLAGKITGDGGPRLTGYTHRLKMKGQVVGRGATVGQRGCRLDFYPKAGSGPSVLTGTVSLAGEKDVNYCGASFFYCPEVPGEHPFSIGTVDANDADWVEGLTYAGRRGATLSTCSNNTYNVGSLTGAGVHLRAAIPPDGGVWNAANDVEKFGPANFVFGQINGSAGMNIYVSSNVSVTVTNIAKSTAFHYEVMSNGVNTAVLDIEGNVADGTTITATDVAMLPARIKGFTGNITLTETNQTGTVTYPVVFDFDQKGGIPIGGCDGSGNLVAAPTSGTIELTFAGDHPKTGNWGILKFDSVLAGMLDGWTISPESAVYKGYVVTVTKTATGFELHAGKGLMLIVR